MQWFRDKLDLPSRAKFYLWRLSGNSFEGVFKLKNGSTIILRPKPFQDIATVTEVFATDLYDIPDQIKHGGIVSIVDLGANVGFTYVYWLSKYPQAHVTAFEPHPKHLKQIKKHLEANSSAGAVTLVPKAAGVAQGALYLTDDEYSSTLVNTPTEQTITVDVADWIAEIGNDLIDLLKIDVEGSEYALLSDPRFGQLNLQVCVLEWHNTEEFPNGRDWCEKRLAELGYQCCEGVSGSPNNGLLWAWKS